ncbi:MAG: MAPEG family protein [Candidatus Binatia bacterium]
MTTELYYLALVAVITTLMWIPYGMSLTLGQGLTAGLGNRDQVKPLDPWAERAKRAHGNAVENLVVFGALVLVAHGAGVHNGTTEWAAVIYFWMRLAHYASYAFGIIGLRTVVWSIAWLCQIAIAWQVLA